MTQLRLMLSLGMLLLSHQYLMADDAKKDQEAIQGTWEVLEFTLSGKSIPDEQRKELRFEFSGDVMKLKGGPGGVREYKFTLDPSKTPRALDTIPQDGPYKGKTGPAIYELTDDTLKLCIPNTQTTERPTEFKAPEGSSLGLFILKRSKS